VSWLVEDFLAVSPPGFGKNKLAWACALWRQDGSWQGEIVRDQAAGQFPCEAWSGALTMTCVLPTKGNWVVGGSLW
jgi:hypothetical protein